MFPEEAPPVAVGWRGLLVEPRRAHAVRESPRHNFPASPTSVKWVGQAYLLVLAGLLSAVGRLADMVGRKLPYM